MNQVAIIGLGRMGKNVALHLLKQGVSVVAYNRSRDDVDEVIKVGAVGAYTLTEIRSKLSFDSGEVVVAIIFIPAGAAIDEVLFGARARTTAFREFDAMSEKVQAGLVDILPNGSIIIDGGNSFYQDSQRRYKMLKAKGIHFLDMGTSGGLEGARNGACLMVGGDEEAYARVRPLLEKIACPDGLGFFGPSGAGHFVKMIHNAVEYGMMGAIAEGFNLIKNYEFGIINYGEGKKFPSPKLGESKGEVNNRTIEQYNNINLAKLARVWSHGSIVSGLLMDKAAQAFAKDPELVELTGEVPRGETEAEMEWLETTEIPHPVIVAARKERVATRKNPSFIGRVIAALRREFGGHAVKSNHS